jgi:hypothetical protein
MTTTPRGRTTRWGIWRRQATPRTKMPCTNSFIHQQNVFNYGLSATTVAGATILSAVA